MTEVEKLRISLARIAQVLEVPADDLPGSPASYAYEDLCKAAQVERGWHKLASLVAWMVNNVLESKPSKEPSNAS
jgi:hypothetical protein